MSPQYTARSGESHTSCTHVDQSSMYEHSAVLAWPGCRPGTWSREEGAKRWGLGAFSWASAALCSPLLPAYSPQVPGTRLGRVSVTLCSCMLLQTIWAQLEWLAQILSDLATCWGLGVKQELHQGETEVAPAAPAAPMQHCLKQCMGTQCGITAWDNPCFLALFPLHALPCQQGEPYPGFNSHGRPGCLVCEQLRGWNCM